MLILQICGSVVSTSVPYSCQDSPFFPFYAPLFTISLPYTYVLFLPTYLCLVSAACFWTLFLVVFSQKETCLNKKHETVKLFVTSNQNQNVAYKLLPVCYPSFRRRLHNTTSLSLFFYRMSEAMWSLPNALYIQILLFCFRNQCLKYCSNFILVACIPLPAAWSDVDVIQVLYFLSDSILDSIDSLLPEVLSINPDVSYLAVNTF